jgi:hypothetical protein
MYNYWAYGLTIRSDVEFPELLPLFANEIHDIEIVVGVIPKHSHENLGDEKKSIYISNEEYKLTIDGVATYWAEKGIKIIIQPQELSDINKVRLFCLSNVFAALLNQRRIIPMHAAALLVNNLLVLICGQSGAGKSTLLAALAAHGFTVFSDDVCVPVAVSNDEVLMYASYPMMKFWTNTIERFPYLGEPDLQLRPDVNKYGFYFHEKFDKIPKQPVAVFFLEKSETSFQVEMMEVKGYQMFQHLESNAYRGEYLSATDLRQEHFSLFSKLANQLSGFVVKRPADIDSIDCITNLVVETIKKKLLT